MENRDVEKTFKLGELEFHENDNRPLGGLNPYSPSFDIIGKQYLKLLIDHANLTPSSKILDIGCGTGRLAKQLEPFLNSGSYIGFDNNVKYLEYCKNNYSSKLKFDHIDIQHDEFNPNGVIDATSIELPYQNKKFDIVVVLGVFNHFQYKWAAQYIRQASRILKPKGIFFGTFILLNQLSMAAIETNQTSKPFKFGYKSEDAWYENQDRKLLNVALPEQALRRVFIRSSLMIKEPIRYGQWCNSKLALTGHDIVIARKGGWQ